MESGLVALPMSVGRARLADSVAERVLALKSNDPELWLIERPQLLKQIVGGSDHATGDLDVAVRNDGADFVRCDHLILEHDRELAAWMFARFFLQSGGGRGLQL